MRTVLTCGRVGTIGILLTFTSGLAASSQSSRAHEILAAARQALGGDARLSDVRTFRIKGSIKSIGRQGTQFGAFEIACELPDKFVQVEDRASASAGETASVAPFDAAFLNSMSGVGPSAEHHIARVGFNGDRVIYERTPSRYTMAGPPPPRQADLRAYLPTARAAFVNITLPLFAASFAGLPLQFNDATEPDAGTAVQITGSGLTGTLRFDPRTHLPERLEQLRYEDYRDVDGRKVPFRITNGYDEWNIKEFVVNVKIPPSVFRPSGS